MAVTPFEVKARQEILRNRARDERRAKLEAQIDSFLVRWGPGTIQVLEAPGDEMVDWVRARYRHWDVTYTPLPQRSDFNPWTVPASQYAGEFRFAEKSSPEGA